MNNKQLYDKAYSAIHGVFEDLSVTQAVCEANLVALRDEIDILISVLEMNDDKDVEDE